jgi:acyl-CoA dehydrogenase
MIRDATTLNVMVDTIREFAVNELIPREVEVTENDYIPEEIINKMKELGIFGLSIPEEYGGLGLTFEEEINVVFALCYASPVFRSIAGTNIGIGSLGITMNGNREQKEKYLPKLASGEMIASFCLTEPDVGSDAAALKTTAIKKDNSYIINGTKRFITNAPEAGLFTVFARTNLEEKKAKGISAFIVERNNEGISIGPHEKKMGMLGGHVADVTFEDCKIPLSALLGEEGRGFISAMKILERARIHMAAVSVAVAERIIDESVKYAVSRKQFDRPIADFQMIQSMIAESKAECNAAKCAVIDAARHYDDGKPITLLSSCCKLFATEMVNRVADRGVQIHGGYGYIRDNAVERLYRDVRLFRLYEGTSEIQKLIIARNLIKEFIQ